MNIAANSSKVLSLVTNSNIVPLMEVSTSVRVYANSGVLKWVEQIKSNMAFWKLSKIRKFAGAKYSI